MIKILLEFCLVYPYKRSLFIIHDLAFLWGIRILFSSTNREKVLGLMPLRKYKQLFKHNPRIGEIDIPIKMKKFVSQITIRKIHAT